MSSVGASRLKAALSQKMDSDRGPRKPKEPGFGAAVKIGLHADRLQREFENTLVQARRPQPSPSSSRSPRARPATASSFGTDSGLRRTPRPFLEYTPPPHGAVDEELPNAPPSVDADAMAPFMTDFVAEWRLGFSAEQTAYKSFVLYMEVKLRQGLLVTARLGLPNPYRTAIVCECLERLSGVFGRYDACLRVLRGELLRAVYLEYEPTRPGETVGFDTHMRRTPYFARCAELEAELEETKVAFRQHKEQTEENMKQRAAWDKLINRIERAGQEAKGQELQEAKQKMRELSRAAFEPPLDKIMALFDELSPRQKTEGLLRLLHAPAGQRLLVSIPPQQQLVQMSSLLAPVPQEERTTLLVELLKAAGPQLLPLLAKMSEELPPNARLQWLLADADATSMLERAQLIEQLMAPLTQQQKVECAVALLHSLKAIEMEQVLAKLLSEQPDYRLLPLLSAVLENLAPEQNHELLASLLGVLPAALLRDVLQQKLLLLNATQLESTVVGVLSQLPEATLGQLLLAASTDPLHAVLRRACAPLADAVRERLASILFGGASAGEWSQPQRAMFLSHALEHNLPAAAAATTPDKPAAAAAAPPTAANAAAGKDDGSGVALDGAALADALEALGARCGEAALKDVLRPVAERPHLARLLRPMLGVAHPPRKSGPTDRERDDAAAARAKANALLAPPDGKKKKGVVGEVVPMDNLLRLVSALYQMRIREDTLSDARGRARPPFTKFVRDYIMRQYGMRSLADKAIADLRVSAIKYSAEWSHAVTEATRIGEPTQPAVPRAGVFCSLCGFGHQAEQWGERKGAFFFALLQALVPTDAMKELLATVELYVSVDAASAALELVVLDAALRKELVAKLLASDKLQAATGEHVAGFGAGSPKDRLEGSGTLGQRLPYDTVVEIVMASWEEQEQYKAARSATVRTAPLLLPLWVMYPLSHSGVSPPCRPSRSSSSPSTRTATASSPSTSSRSCCARRRTPRRAC